MVPEESLRQDSSATNIELNLFGVARWSHVIPGVQASDDRCIEVIAKGLPLHRGEAISHRCHFGLAFEAKGRRTMFEALQLLINRNKWQDEHDTEQRVP